MTTADPARRALILRAAAEEFRWYGLDGARRSRITAAAGLTSAEDLFDLFGSKLELFEAVADAGLLDT